MKKATAQKTPPAPTKPTKPAKGEVKKAANTSAKAAATKKTGAAPRVLFPNDHIIKLVIDHNPKRGASAERFALYRSGMTVEDALKAGVRRADLKWDTQRNFIEIAPTK